VLVWNVVKVPLLQRMSKRYIQLPLQPPLLANALHHVLLPYVECTVKDTHMLCGCAWWGS
jgi:hypothetical protein